MVGGSGLYVNAVLEGLDHFPAVDPDIRKSLIELLDKDGLPALQSKLKKLDVDSYQNIELSNPHRVIRALEICIGTEQPFSSFKNQPKLARPFIPIKIGLHAPREIMYNRINKRVDIMMKNGLLDEVNNLFKYRHLNALQTVGYKELFSYLDGEVELEFAVNEIKKNTRRFAKRQETWNRKDPDIEWFHFKVTPKEVINYIETSIAAN